MADTLVSGALVFPQDEGLPNISDGSESWVSSGSLMSLAQAIGSGSYVLSENELIFANHDGTNNEVDVTAGIAYIDLSGETVTVQSTLGGESAPAYDTTLPTNPSIMVVVPSTVANLSVQDATLSEVWLAYDTDGTGPGTAGSVYLRSDDTGSVTAPTHPNVKLGETNPDNASADVLSSRYANCRLGRESANAEEPTASLWQTGDIVEFTDTGDGSGDGVYLLKYNGNWQAI